MFKKILKWLFISVGIITILYVVTFGILGYLHRNISSQGEILATLSDTKFLSDDSLVLFFRGESLYSIKLNGLDEKKIYNEVSAYRWSPNGKKIVLETIGRKANKQIVIVDLNTGTIDIVEDIEKLDPRKLSEWYAQCDLPEWSPDSKKIAYILNGGKYKSNIYIYEVDTKKKTKIERSPNYADGPKWMVDGWSLLYYELFTKKYYKYELDLKEIIELSLGQDVDKIDWGNLVDINKVHFNQCVNLHFWHGARISPNNIYRAYNKEGSL